MALEPLPDPDPEPDPKKLPDDEPLPLPEDEPTPEPEDEPTPEPEDEPLSDPLPLVKSLAVTVATGVEVGESRWTAARVIGRIPAGGLVAGDDAVGIKTGGGIATAGAGGAAGAA